MDYRAALICGIDLPIPECQLIAHQPSISEIAFVGEADFFIGVQALCLYKSMFIEDKTLSDDITNFQIFMTIMMDKESKKQKDAVNKVLKLCFPEYKILITPNSLIFTQVKQEDQPQEQKQQIPSIMVDEKNFESLQIILRKIFCMKDGPMDQQAFNPGNAKAQEIAKKLMRGRDRIAAEKGGSNSSVFSQYISILTVGLNSMSMQDLTKLTMFQLYDLIDRYNLYVKWDLDIRARLAGAKPKEESDNWMKNIH